jgi:hypothetical protein
MRISVQRAALESQRLSAMCGGQAGVARYAKALTLTLSQRKSGDHAKDVGDVINRFQAAETKAGLK